MKYIFILMLMQSCFSQAQSKEKKPKKTLLIRVAAMGDDHVRTYARDANGTVIEQDAPFYAYKPQSFWVIKKKSKEKAEYQPLNLGDNRPWDWQKIKRGSSIKLFRITEKGDRKMAKSIVFREQQTHSLVLVIKDHKNEKTGWEKPLIKNLDVSLDKFPKNSYLFYNALPFKVSLKIKSSAANKNLLISPKQKIILKFTNTALIHLSATAITSGGENLNFFDSEVNLEKGGRTYTVAVYTPQSKQMPISLVRFEDSAEWLAKSAVKKTK